MNWSRGTSQCHLPVDGGTGPEAPGGPLNTISISPKPEPYHGLHQHLQSHLPYQPGRRQFDQSPDIVLTCNNRFSSFRERLQLSYHIPLEFLVKRINPCENDDFAFCTSIPRKHFIASTGVTASERLLIHICTTTFRSLGLGSGH